MNNFIAVGLGGFIGANLRYALSRVMPAAAFPFATLAANALAGLCIGAVIGLEGSAAALSPKWKLFINTGLLGGLSTFSTFSLETVTLFGNGSYVLGAANIVLNISLSLSGAALGMAVVKLIAK